MYQQHFTFVLYPCILSLNIGINKLTPSTTQYKINFLQPLLQ
jgi:hypothetical protein